MTDFKRKLFVAIIIWFAATIGQTVSAYSLLPPKPWSQDGFNPNDPYYYLINIYGGLPPGNEEFEDAYEQSLLAWQEYSLLTFFDAASTPVAGYKREYRPPSHTNSDDTPNCDSSIGFHNQDIDGNHLQSATLAIAETSIVCQVRVSFGPGSISLIRFTFIPTDITFNSDLEWDIYDGPGLSPPYDFRRVALHEIGHLLGLGHPDETPESQSVTAIMNSNYTSNLYTLQTDDIAGLRALYGHPPVQEVAASTDVSVNRIEVAWSSVLAASEYRVLRVADFSDNIADYTHIATVTTLSYSEEGLAPGDIFSYKVLACTRAINGPVCSGDSPVGIGHTRLSTPTNVTVSDGTSSDYIEISWDAVVGATHYQLYRSSTQRGTGLAIASTADSTYRDSSATPGVTFYYRVQACINVVQIGERCFSVSSADSGHRRLSGPINVEATDGDSANYIRVSWDAVVGANNYLVSRSAGLAGNYEHVATVTAPVYDDTEATAGQRLYYRVQACADVVTGQICSEPSDTAAGYRDLSIPTNVAASDDNTHVIHVTWDAVDDAVGYCVYRLGDTGLALLGTGFTPFAEILDPSTIPGAFGIYAVQACGDFCLSSSVICSGLSESVIGSRKLNAPTGVTASQGDSADYIEIAWDDISDAMLRYSVFRSNTQSGDFVFAAEVTTSLYRDTDTTPGVTFYYRIQACSDTCSDNSAVVSGWRNLSTPTDVTASQGDNTDHIEVTWDNTSGAASYLIYRADNLADDFVTLATVTDTVHRDTTTTPGIIFYYRVRACSDDDGNGVCGSVSDAVAGWRNLSTPTDITASQGDSAGHIEVTWDNTAGAASYLIYRADNLADDFVALAAVTDTIHRDTTTTPGIIFYYRVRACSDGNGNGVCGSVSDAVAGWRNLSTPTNITASQGGSTDHIEVTWDNTSGAASYLIYRADNLADDFVTLAAVTDTIHRDTTTTPGIIFYYRVRACSDDDGNGVCGGLSDAAAGWRNLSSPTNVQASDGTSTDRVVIFWDYVRGALDYQIERSSTLLDGYSDLITVTSLSYDDKENFGAHAIRYYRLQACTSLGCSEYSSPVRGHRGLSAPTNVGASDGQSNVHVSWNDVSSAEFYAIYRSAFGQPFALDEESPYIDTSAGSQRHSYRVRACTGSMSDPICGVFSDADIGITAEGLGLLRFYIRIFLEGAQ